MPNFGPPTFFPAVPINEPGNGPQGVTLEAGIPVFVPQNIAPAFSTGRGLPLEGPLEIIPPVTFQQDDENVTGDVTFEPGIPEFVPEAG